jgi:hypothetical protein
MTRTLNQEAAFCSKCNTTTNHLITRRDGEITKMLCRKCKHVHVPEV